MDCKLYIHGLNMTKILTDSQMTFRTYGNGLKTKVFKGMWTVVQSG